jgi:predicted transcriptional regulator of viral defense system
MDTITGKIIRRIKAKRRGWVFTPKDLLDIGTRAAVDKVLSRLVKQGMIRRLGHGLYDFPKTHKLLGVLSPNADNIARAVASKTGDIAHPSGAMAANMLGLSTQVPAKPVYLTNGVSRTAKLGSQTIAIKHARVPIIHNAPVKVNYTLQALSYLGKSSIDDQVINRFSKILSDSDMRDLHAVMSHMPGWMADTIHKIQHVKDGLIRKIS